MIASGVEAIEELSVLIDTFGAAGAEQRIGRSEPLSTVTEFQVSCMKKMPWVPLIVLEIVAVVVDGSPEECLGLLVVDDRVDHDRRAGRDYVVDLQRRAADAVARPSRCRSSR